VIGDAIDQLLEHFGTRAVGTLTPAACEAYVAWRTAQHDPRFKRNGTGKTIAATTARRELVVLAAAINWNFRERKLDRPIPISLPPMGEPRERHLTRREAAALLWGALGFDQEGRRRGEINRHVARFILIGLYTGTRHRSILKLQWMRNTTGGWFDLDTGILYRRPEDAVESKKRRTTIPIPPRLLPHLIRWKKLTARHVIEYDGKAITGKLRRAWKSARTLAGLDAKVTPHILRHSCATWLLQRGVTTFDVAGVLGCGEQVVRDTYGHHAKDHLRAAVGAFSARR
jgi:integrase